MTVSFRPIISLILVFTVFTGCVEENRQSGLSGTLIGFVTAYNKTSNLFSDQSGVSVLIEGTEKPITLITDSQGQFTVDELKTGTYDIILSKEGFGTHKIIGYGFIGGENPASISTSIYELPDAAIENIEVKDMSNSFEVVMEFKVFVDHPAQSSNSGIYRYYLDNSSSISGSRYIDTGVVYAPVGAGTFIFLKTIDTNLFLPGTDAYIMVLPCTEPNQNYIDIETGNLIFSSAKTSLPKVVSFKVPE